MGQHLNLFRRHVAYCNRTVHIFNGFSSEQRERDGRIECHDFNQAKCSSEFELWNKLSNTRIDTNWNTDSSQLDSCKKKEKQHHLMQIVFVAHGSCSLYSFMRMRQNSEEKKYIQRNGLVKNETAKEAHTHTSAHANSIWMYTIWTALAMCWPYLLEMWLMCFGSNDVEDVVYMLEWRAR